MHNICTYRIEVKAQIDAKALNALSPHQMTVLSTNRTATLFTICTDQSGLLGFIRHLHAQGVVLLSISRDSFLIPQGE